MTHDEQSSSSEWTDAFRPSRFAALLGLLALVSYPGVAFCVETFVLRDFAAFGYPLAHYHRESFWAGEIPFWNPLSHAGVPFLAQWNTMVLYPGSLIYLLLPLKWSLSWFCLIHLYCAGMGAYFLVRHWTGNAFAAALAGVGYAFNGLLLNSLMWPNNIAALAWLPWVVWTVDLAVINGRKAVAIAAFAGTMQMLTGAPEVILLGWVLTCFVVFIRIGQLWPELRTAKQRVSPFGRLLVVVGLISGMSAVQLMPFFDWFQLANRSVEMDAVGWAAGKHVWANFLLPWFNCTHSRTGLYTQVSQQWTHSFYPGIGLLVLVALSVRGRFRALAIALGLLGLFCVGLSLGESAFFYRWLGSLLHLGEMRFPVKFLIPLSLILPLLAGCGLGGALTRKQIGISAAAILLLALAAYIVGITIAGQRGDEGFTWNSTLRVIALVAFTGLLWWHAGAATKPIRIGSAVAVLIVLWVDLRFHSPGMTPTTSTSIWNTSDRQETGRIFLTPAARERLSSSRAESEAENAKLMLSSRLANANLLASTAKCYGFYSLPPADAADMMRCTVRDMNTVHEPMADFLGVTQAGVLGLNALQWVPRSTAMPLVTAGQKPLFGDRTNVLKALNSIRFDPRRMVALSPDEKEHVIGEAATGTTVTSLQTEAQIVRFQVKATDPTLAVIAQTWHPNWRAFVNGAPTRLLRANIAFQAVNVPAGESEVELRYVDPAFRNGAWITLICVVLTAALWCSGRQRSDENTSKST